MSDLLKFNVSALNTKTILLEWSIEPSDLLLEHIIKFKSLIEKDTEIHQCVVGYKSIICILNEVMTNVLVKRN
mgnify:CR=1 FL=1